MTNPPTMPPPPTAAPPAAADPDVAPNAAAPDTPADAVGAVIGEGRDAFHDRRARNVATRAQKALTDQLKAERKASGSVLTAFEARGLAILGAVDRDAVASPLVAGQDELQFYDARKAANDWPALVPEVEQVDGYGIVVHIAALRPESVNLLLATKDTCPPQLKDLAAAAGATLVLDLLRAAVPSGTFRNGGVASRPAVEAKVNEARVNGRRWVLIVGPTAPADLGKELEDNQPDGAVVRMEEPVDPRLSTVVGAALLVSAPGAVVAVWQAWGPAAEARVGSPSKGVEVSVSGRRRVERLTATPLVSTRFTAGPAAPPAPPPVVLSREELDAS